MRPYSEKEQKHLVEQLCRDLFTSAGKKSEVGAQSASQAEIAPSEAAALHEPPPLLQVLFDLEFEQKFSILLQSIYRRLPAL